MGKISVNEPLLNENEKHLCGCINTGRISSEGSFVKEFEQKMSATVGREYGITVTNGTTDKFPVLWRLQNWEGQFRYW